MISLNSPYEPHHEKTKVLHMRYKDVDQLCGNRETDQRLCFCYTESAIPLLSKPLAIFCDFTARFVWDLVGNPEDRFSHNEAHINISCRYCRHFW